MSRRVVIVVLLLMCCAVNSWAQWPVDSAKRKTFAELNTKYKDAVIVIDGVVTTAGQLSQDKVFDIIAINKDNPGASRFGAGHDLIVATTKAAVMVHYQKTLSALSLDYRNYLDAHHNDDDDLQYIVNNIPLKSNTDEQLDMLYKLGPEKIANVAFTEVKGKKTLIIDVRYDE